MICSIVCNFLSIMQLKLMKKNLSTIERNLLFSTLASSVIQCAAAGNTVFFLKLNAVLKIIIFKVIEHKISYIFIVDSFSIALPSAEI